MMCVSAVFLIATTAIKCFAVDLVLFSRRFLPCTKARNGEYITELPSTLVKKTPICTSYKVLMYLLEGSLVCSRGV